MLEADTDLLTVVLVNGTRHEMPGRLVNYHDIAKLARRQETGEESTSAMPLYSITYSGGEYPREHGSLSPASSPVRLKPGLSFNAYVTSGA